MSLTIDFIRWYYVTTYTCVNMRLITSIALEPLHIWHYMIPITLLNRAASTNVRAIKLKAVRNYRDKLFHNNGVT